MSCVRSAEPGATQSLTPLPLEHQAISERPRAPVVVELVPYASRLVTVRAIAGIDTLRLLFDTGGGRTLLAPDVAHRLGCIPSGHVMGFRMTGERVEFTQCPGATLTIGQLSVRHAPIGVFDLMALLPAGLPRLDGVLSLETFAGQTITLNLLCRRLIVESPASARERTRGMRPIAMRIATGPSGAELTAFLRVDATPIPLWLEFDSGNLGYVLLSPESARALGMGTITGRDSAITTQLAVSGLEARSTRAGVSDLIHDGALSAEFISQGEFTLDLASGMAWADLSSKTLKGCA